MDQPNPSPKVRELVFEGKKLDAIHRYRKEAGVKTTEAKAVVDQLAAGKLGSLLTQRDAVIVHRKQATRAVMGKWLQKDIERMAREGYVEVSHEERGVARGCGALFAPPISEMVVSYRRTDAPSGIAAEAPSLN